MKLLELMLKIDGSWVVLDTNDDLSIPITYNISDIRDISTLNSSFTKSIKIPMSDRNMKYLSNIAQITSDGIINVNKKIPARVFSEGLLQLDGIIQFRKIISEDGVDYVESVIYAAGDSIFQTLGELELRDLDWSGLNHNWTRENIIATWTADWKTGYYYPLIDYGWDWTINDINKPDDVNKRINTEHFYPATYVKYMLDRIFAENSWTYTSDFFNTDTFKNLVIPFNSGQMKPDVDYVANRQFRVSLTVDKFHVGAGSTLAPLSSNSSSNSITPELNNETAPNGDPSNQWNTTTFTFTQPSVGLQAQQFVLDLEWEPGDFGIGPDDTKNWKILWINWYRAGEIAPFWQNSLNYKPTLTGRMKHQFSTPVLGGENSNFSALQNNETLQVKVFLGKGGTFRDIRQGITIYKETKLFNVIENKIMRQQEIDYNSAIPVMKQRDFLLNITKMFNLFIIPDPNDEGNFLIEPRDEYYKGGTIKDWTKKIHKGGIREWNILGELQNKELLFTYKDDKDILNTDYKAKTARTWGEHKHIVDNDFIKGQKKVEVTFSPTVISNIPGANDMVIPKIMMSTTPGVKSIQTGPRILLKKLMPNSQPWYFGAQVQNNYPYAGHFDDPLFGDVDINFGQTLGAYYIDNPIITGNLYNMYWESYIDEITDKDSKILMAEFNLNPYDIFTFKFNDIIQIEDLYYRINKIIDYDPNIRELTKVELIKIKDVRIKRVAGKPSSGTTGGGGGFNPGGIKPTVKPTLQPDGPGGGPGPGTGGTKPVRDKINMLGDSGSSENQSFSRGTIQSGYDLVVGVDSEGSMMTGERNTIGDNSKNSTIIGGSDNIIAPSAPNNTLMNTQNSEIQTAVEGSTILGGEYHYIGASNSHIIGGTGNTIESDAVGTTLIGVTNFTATQSNTTYIGGDTIYITGDTIISGSVSGVGLPDVLMDNNTTGGNDIVMSNGDVIKADVDNFINITTGGISLSSDVVVQMVNGVHTITTDLFGEDSAGIRNADFSHYIYLSDVLDSVGMVNENTGGDVYISNSNYSQEIFLTDAGGTKRIVIDNGSQEILLTEADGGKINITAGTVTLDGRTKLTTVGTSSSIKTLGVDSDGFIVEATGGGSPQDLQDVLSIGNSTGTYSIITGEKIISASYSDINIDMNDLQLNWGEYNSGFGTYSKSISGYDISNVGTIKLEAGNFTIIKDTGDLVESFQHISATYDDILSGVGARQPFTIIHSKEITFFHGIGYGVYFSGNSTQSTTGVTQSIDDTYLVDIISQVPITHQVVLNGGGPTYSYTCELSSTFRNGVEIGEPTMIIKTDYPTDMIPNVFWTGPVSGYMTLNVLSYENMDWVVVNKRIV